MGVVYAAYDAKLDRRVAIKLLRPKKRARSGIRLIREAQALARLSHPNVVQIYEIGEHEGQPFLVMELLDGLTLERWRAERVRTRADILDVFLAAGRGLAAAHAKGLIHRDFKPDNLMICRDGRVVVMDFGLARGDERSDSPSSSEDLSLIGEAANADPYESDGELNFTAASKDSTSSSAGPRSSELARPLTMVGAVIGTVGYMAPEQALGQTVHDRCDQFSFCATLWEALYGKRPFKGKQLDAFLSSVLSGPPTPREPNDVPMWLRKVVERGLALSPDDRWPSMNELLDALQRDPTRRRRSFLASAFVLGLGAAAAGGVYVVEQRERERAEQQRDEQIAACEREGQAITQDWNEEVATVIEQAFAATNSSLAASAWQHTRPWFDDYAHEWSAVRTQICVEASVDRTRDENSMALALDCLDEGHMYLVGVLDTLTSLGTEDASMVPSATSTAARLQPPAFCTNEALLQHRQLIPVELRNEITDLRLKLERARGRTFLGDHERGLREAQAVIEASNALGWTPLAVRAGYTASAMQIRLGKYEDAKRTARQAYWAAAGDNDALSMLLAATELAAAHSYLADFEEGLGWALLGKTLLENLELGGTIHEALVLERLSLNLRGMGDDEETLVQQTRAVEVYEAVLGPQHPVVGLALMNLGSTLSFVGNYRAALECKYRALAILENSLGPQHSDVGGTLNNIGAELAKRGDYERALELFQRSLTILEATLGSEHPFIPMGLCNVADMLCQRDECEKALEMHRRALALQESTLGADHPSVGATHEKIGIDFDSLGSHDEALEHFRKTLTIFESKHGPEHAYTLGVRIQIATTLGHQGHIELAIEQLRAVLDQLEGQGDLDLYSGALQEYGLALLEHGDIEDARDQLERALGLREHQGLVGVQLANTRFALAQALAATGDDTQAHELADEAEAGFRASGAFGAHELAELEAWRSKHLR